MARPNISKEQILNSLRNGAGALVSMNSLIADNEFSEVTVRTGIKQLLASGTIEVNKENKPYSYRLKDA